MLRNLDEIRKHKKNIVNFQLKINSENETLGFLEVRNLQDMKKLDFEGKKLLLDILEKEESRKMDKINNLRNYFPQQ